MEKRRRQWLEWNRRTIVGAYDRVGKKDPEWDQPARQALDRAVRMFTNFYHPAGAYEEIRKPAHSAVAAGCDDPMVVYLYQRSLGGRSYRRSRRMEEAARALGGSRYPAFRRALALAGQFAEGGPAEQDEVDAVLALLTESVAGDEHNEFWEDRWFRIGVNLISASRHQIELRIPRWRFGLVWLSRRPRRGPIEALMPSSTRAAKMLACAPSSARRRCSMSPPITDDKGRMTNDH
jgi:hypothetical protein